MRKNIKDTSWEKSSTKYNKEVGIDGHYYHRQVIMPRVLELLNLKQGDSILDLACGQGILSRNIPVGVEYLGLDLSQSLIKDAQSMNKNLDVNFLKKDVSKDLKIKENNFSHSTIILALQNIKDGKKAILNAKEYLRKNGILLIVLNHPSYRIPRHAGWDENFEQQKQARWVDNYMTPLEIPIIMHPGKANSEKTWSFHNPLSIYSRWLKSAGFYIEEIDELISDKKSFGKNAKMENKARLEIPMFMIIKAIKK